MEDKKLINNGIEIEEMWEGLGGNFDNIQQIICEFIDNSVSNLTGKNSGDIQQKLIIVEFNVISENDILVKVEDSGTGICDLDSCFKIGSKKAQESPLNEHGFGMKHALAAADKENKLWKIYTRTREDVEKNQYELIEAPYKTQEWYAKINNASEIQWPGYINGTGTIVEFHIDNHLLSTLTDGIPGANERTSNKRKIEYFIEEVAFTYSNILRESGVKINVKLYENGLIKDENVIGLVPDWKETQLEGSEDCKLGNGYVTINYKFGSINASNNIRYYRRNLASSGVEIRINGRALEYGLFSEIWQKARHPSYNHFLGIINIISDNKDDLPETKTAKNSFKYNDSKYDELIRWIHNKFPTVKEVEESNDDYNEVSIFKTLANNLKTFGDPNDVVNTEEYVFEDEMNLRIDLYQCHNNKVTIFEGKKMRTTPKDVYQLRTYWDGLVYKKIVPSEGIIIASGHPDSVCRMVEFVNMMKDANGNNYNIIMKTWDDYNIL